LVLAAQASPSKELRGGKYGNSPMVLVMVMVEIVVIGLIAHATQGRSLQANCILSKCDAIIILVLCI
jgi:hypothetical protein